MDVVSSVAAVVGLVFNFATAIKTCNDLRSRYKDAARTIESIRHELETLQGALHELANIMMRDASALTSRWDTNKVLPRTFARAIAGFNRTIKSLQDDMEVLRRSPAQLGKMVKVKLLWNEDSMRDHLGQLRAQSSALQLLLLVLQTAALSDVKSNLNNVEAALVQLSVSSNGFRDEALPEYQDNEQDESGYISGESRSGLETATPGPSVPEISRATTSSSSGTTSNPIIQPLCAPSIHIEAPALFGETIVPDISPKEASLPSLAPSSPSVQKITPEKDTSSEGLLIEKRTRDSHLTTSPDEKVESPGPSEQITHPAAALGSGELSQPTSGTTKKKMSKRKEEEFTSTDSASLYRLPALINAVTNGNLIEVIALLDAGTNLEDRQPVNDRTSIIIAASLGYSEILEALLGKLSGSVSTKDREKRTALHYAASEGHLSCVHLLLAHSASVSVQDFTLENPLHRAIRYGRVEVVKALLAQEPTPLRSHARSKRNSLHIAAVNRRAEIVRLISEKIRKYEHREGCASSKENVPTCDCPVTYPGIDEEDNLGNTAFQNAIKSGDVETVSAFIKYTAYDVNAPYRLNLLSNKDLLTTNSITWRRPLHFAASQKNAHLLAVLLAAGADVNLLDNEGVPPIERAIRKKNKETLIEFLKHGARFDIPSKNEETSLLELAVENFTSTVLDDLISTQPNIDLCTPSGRLLLRVAQVNNKWEIVETLVKNCAQADAVGKILDAESTLQLALKHSTSTIVKLLLEKGADANRKFEEADKSWQMPLHKAATYGDTAKANELIKYGAKILMKDSTNWWPLHHAIHDLDLHQISWFLQATKVGLKEAKSVSSTSEAIQHDYELDLGLRIACRIGILEKLELIFELLVLRSDPASPEVLHATVKYGRVDMTKFVLEQGHDPLLINREKLLATEVPFQLLMARDGLLLNSTEDYEKCKEMVQAAINEKNEETARAAAAAAAAATATATSDATAVKWEVDEHSSTSGSENKPQQRTPRRSRAVKSSIWSSLAKNSRRRGHTRKRIDARVVYT